MGRGAQQNSQCNEQFGLFATVHYPVSRTVKSNALKVEKKIIVRGIKFEKNQIFNKMNFIKAQ